ncbi:hypothetical protein FACS189459_5240 [Bacilli bacterium]|nr:hypothetical protein FACS189459_5130 [Bacilli bacterium]GHU50755.1 hypothetical protein FACS189459_5240 [Bacilli bacterium]
MSREDLIVSNTIGNMKLEGFILTPEIINMVKNIANSNLSIAESDKLADRYEQELINKYSK